jgi:hypothetical protein
MPCCTSALLITLTWALLVAPLAAEAQPSAPPMLCIGLLSSRSPLVARPYVEAFRQEVRALGYIDGQPLKPQRRFYQLQELRKFHRGAAECRLQASCERSSGAARRSEPSAPAPFPASRSHQVFPPVTRASPAEAVHPHQCLAQGTDAASRSLVLCASPSRL